MILWFVQSLFVDWEVIHCVHLVMKSNWPVFLWQAIECDTHLPAIHYQKTHDPTPPNPTPTPNKSTKRILETYLGVLGGLESTRANHASWLGGVSNYLVTGHVRKHTKLIFVICNTSNSSPILICCVQKHLIWCFVKKHKKGALGNDRVSSFQNKQMGPWRAIVMTSKMTVLCPTKL